MKRWWLVVLVTMCFVTPARQTGATAPHAVTQQARAFWGTTSQRGPSAEVVDAPHGVIYKVFAGSQRILVLRTDDLSIVRELTLPLFAPANSEQMRVAVNPAGDRLAVLVSSASTGSAVVMGVDGTRYASAQFSLDRRPIALAMTATRAFVLLADTAPLMLDTTIQSLTALPQPSSSNAYTSADGQTLVYPTRDPNSSSRLDYVVLNVVTLEYRVLAIGDISDRAAVAGNTLFVINCGHMQQVNLANGQVVQDIANPTGSCPSDLAVKPDGSTLLVVSALGASLYQVASATGRIIRQTDLQGYAGTVLPAWDAGWAQVNVTYTSAGGYTGMVDLTTGVVVRATYPGQTTDGRRLFNSEGVTLRQYAPASDTWRTAVYGGTVNKLVPAADGTLYVQIDHAIARIPAAATQPDAFFPGDRALVVDNDALYSHNGQAVFMSKRSAVTSQAVYVDGRFDARYSDDLLVDQHKLVLLVQRSPRNVLPEASVDILDLGSSQRTSSAYSQSPGARIALNPLTHEAYLLAGMYERGSEKYGVAKLTTIPLNGGTSTEHTLTGFTPTLTTFAFDAINNLLAVTDGTTLRAFDRDGRQVWQRNVPGAALDVRWGRSWYVGGAGSLAIINASNGTVQEQASTVYNFTAVGQSNTALYGFDPANGALVGKLLGQEGMLLLLEALPMPPTAFATDREHVYLGDAQGQITVLRPEPSTTRPGVPLAFGDAWQRADAPVANNQAQRSWTWGPRPWAVQTESYAEAPSGQRTVEYRDKTRMELTNPNGDSSKPWYVTNGLLVVEMLTGRIQTGDNRFEVRLCNASGSTPCPSFTPLAGDLTDNDSAPSYADASRLLGGAPDSRGQRTGATFTRDASQRFQIGQRPELATEATTLASYDSTTAHNIPQIFDRFMHQRGPVLENGRLVDGLIVDPLYAFGHPLTEPYWIKARVGGTERDVLVQLFERRVLTYTPANPVPYQVEMGNVGQHYYLWRYGSKRW